MAAVWSARWPLLALIGVGCSDRPVDIPELVFVPETADLAVVDLTVADSAVADFAVADLAVADSAVADSAVADFAVADFAVADLAVADLAVADLAVADLAVADLSSDSLSWKISLSGGNAVLHGVWGSSASDVWVVGAAFWHGTGSPVSWETITPTPVTFGYSIWGASASDFQVASLLYDPDNAGVALQGPSWNISRDLNYWGLYGIWGSSAHDVWLVGEDATLIHGSGNPIWWSSVAGVGSRYSLPYLNGGGCRQLFAVWGSSANDVWIVGNDESIFHSNDGSSWLLSHSASSAHGFGCQARNVDILYNGDLRALWGSSASDLWAVGHDGLIVHGTGSPISWTSVPSGTTAHLTGVWGSSASDVWAVGVKGTILHWRGSSWTPSASGTSVDLHGVWGSSPSDVWAVGSSGTILHYGR